MSVLERKQAIESALKAFSAQPLYQAGMGLLDSLGYRSDRTLRVSGLKDVRAAMQAVQSAPIIEPTLEAVKKLL